MALSDTDQAKIADSLSGIATILRGVPTTTTPTPGTGTPVPGTGNTNGGGGTVIGPNFPGRSTVDSKLWKPPSFEENFPSLAKEGLFLPTYTRWNAYPKEYMSTDRKGFYDPTKISVIDTPNGERVMQCRLVPASKSADGKRPSGCAPQPKFGAQGDGRTKGEKIEMRVKVAKAAKGYHAANLGWPLKDEDWPRLGEDDMWETDLDDPEVNAWLHVQNGGSNGERQVGFNSGISALDWFVLGRERIAGKSYKWFVNGKQFGETITKDVPNDFWRWVLQNETSGLSQTEEALVWYDWITIWEPVG